MENLKDDIFIEGFDDISVAHSRFEHLRRLPNGTIFAGETSKIPDDIRIMCTPYHKIITNIEGYCRHKYCIIFKK